LHSQQSTLVSGTEPQLGKKEFGCAGIRYIMLLAFFPYFEKIKVGL
jgi:hypothetical protein